MRVVWLLLVPLAGCQLVFPLDELPPARRAPIDVNLINNDQLTIDLPDDVVAGDQIIATLQARSFSNALTELPSSWIVLDDYPDGGCTDAQWHAWILTTKVAADRSFRFKFAANDDTVTGLLIPYITAAATVRYLRRLTPLNDDTADTAIVLPEAAVAAGSIVYVAGVGDQQPPDDPLGMTRISSFSNIVLWDQPVSGTVPEISVAVPATRCFGASELVLEP